MKTYFRLIHVIIWVLVVAGCTDNQGYRMDSHPISDPYERNQAMQRGINMGNALDAPDLGAWNMEITEEYIQAVADAGFDAVRIPVRWSAHAQETYPYTIQASFFNVVDEAIDWAIDRDLEVMINIHHYIEMMEEPEMHKSRLLGIWEQVASRYKEYPPTLTFELFNEPHLNFTADLWNDYLNDLIHVIRQTNPGRTLVAGTAQWGGIDGLNYLSLPDDDRNIIVTIHYYNPFQFTHQGAGWVEADSDAWIGTTWTGSMEEKSAVDEDFDKISEWAENHDRPIHIGEFGAFSVADMASRELWTAYIARSAEKRDFSWAYWEFGAGFGAYNREKNIWREELLRALIPESPSLGK